MLNSLDTRLKFAGWGGAILLLLGFAWLGWFGGWFGSFHNREDRSVSDQIPSGSLLLTYALKDQGDNSATLLPSLFDFYSGQARYINADLRSTVLSGIHHAMSWNGEWMVFVDSLSRSGANTGLSREWPKAVYRAKLSGTSWPDVVDAAAAATLVGSSSVVAFPDISDSGNILYMSGSPTPGGEAAELFAQATADDWDIILVDLNGNEQFLTKGSHPHWIDDNTFLFLKNQGIFQYSLSSGTETLLIPLLSQAMPTHRLAIDHERRHALLIEPYAGAVRLFDMESAGDGVQLRERPPIMVNAVSAIFSPDGEYVAMTLFPGQFPSQAASSEAPLVVYDLDSNKIYESKLPDASWAFSSLQIWSR